MEDRQKLMLFRWFFTGRPGVYAKRIMGMDGKYRYKPVYAELTDDSIKAHMYGRVMLGGYPILPDSTTHWAAADFDGHNGNAFEHARVFVNALQGYDIRPLCNVSQSGRGVHVRVVFVDPRRTDSRPIHAAVARRFMMKVIEQTELPHLRDGGAFDRVFPSQDYLRSCTSIGNQIAFPFNKIAADERGGSMLLDSCFNRIPLKDSWEFLATYKLIRPIDLFDAAQTMGETHHIFECIDSDNNFLEASRYDGASGDSVHSRNKKFPRTAEQLAFMIRACDFLQWTRSNPGLPYGLWFALASQLIQFDHVGGRGAFHRISAMDTSCDDRGRLRYSPENTDRQYDNALVTMRGSYSCSRIADEGWRCQWLSKDGHCTKFQTRDGRMARSPAFLPFFRGSVTSDDRRNAASDAA